jgi:hypothetical protein
MIDIKEGGWKKVVCAADCKPCDMCGEPWCEECGEHYADCGCPGPTQDEMEYSEDGLYARPLAGNTSKGG